MRRENGFCGQLADIVSELFQNADTDEGLCGMVEWAWLLTLVYQETCSTTLAKVPHSLPLGFLSMKEDLGLMSSGVPPVMRSPPDYLISQVVSLPLKHLLCSSWHATHAPLLWAFIPVHETMSFGKEQVNSSAPHSTLQLSEDQKICMGWLICWLINVNHLELIGKRNYGSKILQNGFLWEWSRAESNLEGLFHAHVLWFCDSAALKLGEIPFLFPLVSFHLKVLLSRSWTLDKSFHLLQ